MTHQYVLGALSEHARIEAEGDRYRAVLPAGEFWWTERGGAAEHLLWFARRGRSLTGGRRVRNLKGPLKEVAGRG